MGYGYTDDNQVQTITYPNGKQVGRTYTDRHQLAVSFDGSTIAANRRKTYEGHQFAADLQTFGYDHEGRVTSWTRDGVESQSWTLSKVGDWESTTVTVRRSPLAEKCSVA